MKVKWMKRVQVHTGGLAHLFGRDESRNEPERRLQSHSGSLARAIESKKGVTMAEVMVTMVLMIIFLTATCRTMSDALGVYYKMKALNNAKQTIDTLMDKVVGEIEGAQVSMRRNERGRSAVFGTEENATLVISADNEKISLYDRTSSSIYITKKDNRLLVHYNPVIAGATGIRYEAVDWKFDEAAYMGFDLTDLKFSLAGNGYPKNVIKVYMKLNSPRYGSYDATRYVECYNFDEEQHMTKILQQKAEDTPEGTP